MRKIDLLGLCAIFCVGCGPSDSTIGIERLVSEPMLEKRTIADVERSISVDVEMCAVGTCMTMADVDYVAE